MREQMRSHQEVAELAERQHGVIAGRQLVELGRSQAAIWREARAGRLHRLHHDVYAVGHRAVSRHGEALAAVLAAGKGAVLSHRSAAWLWGLTRRWQNVVEVTAVSPRRHRDALRLHSASRLRADDRDSYEGVPVTAVPRTMLDFAAVDPNYLRLALDNAQRLGILDLVAMDELLGRCKGFRGVGRLRSALVVFRSGVFTRSGLERRFLSLVRASGLPEPKTNLFIEGYELDAFWPAERFAVELDTYRYHGGHISFEADRIRQEDLKLAGIEMVRITDARLSREPEVVMRRLAQHLTNRRRNLRQPPRA
jgi:very-short-patch-repair endonuclease